MKFKVLCFLLLIFVIHEGKSEAVNSPYKPCDPWDPPLPDFSAPGRRIVTQKCFEYIWLLQQRNIRFRRGLDCLISQCKTPCRAGIGGRDTKKAEFPHMAALGWVSADRKGYVFKCGGSLISDRFVLTAGHCTRIPVDTEISEPVPTIVRLGIKNIKSEDHVDVTIKRIIKHPNYKPPKQYYDIALLELNEPFNFTEYIHPACLLTPADIRKLGVQATATGWGITKLGGKTSDELQAVHIDLIDSHLCDDALSDNCNRHWCGLQEHQICAGNLTGGVDTCQGDSGGPLQLHIPLPVQFQFLGQMNGIVGVTSFGRKCAQANTPGIYTRVASFFDWIENIVWKS